MQYSPIRRFFYINNDVLLIYDCPQFYKVFLSIIDALKLFNLVPAMLLSALFYRWKLVACVGFHTALLSTWIARNRPACMPVVRFDDRQHYRDVNSKPFTITIMAYLIYVNCTPDLFAHDIDRPIDMFNCRRLKWPHQCLA